jgi:hypothetical protein
MNKLIRQTERQEVLTPLVKNTNRSLSVANDSLFFLLFYLKSFIYISFYTHFVLVHFLLHHFISFYNFIILFLSSSYVLHLSMSMYRLPLSVCVNVQIGVSFCSLSCAIVHFSIFSHFIEINSYFTSVTFPFPSPPLPLLFLSFSLI